MTPHPVQALVEAAKHSVHMMALAALDFQAARDLPGPELSDAADAAEDWLAREDEEHGQDYYDTLVVQRGLAEAFRIAADDARKMQGKADEDHARGLAAGRAEGIEALEAMIEWCKAKRAWKAWCIGGGNVRPCSEKEQADCGIADDPDCTVGQCGQRVLSISKPKRRAP